MSELYDPRKLSSIWEDVVERPLNKNEGDVTLTSSNATRSNIKLRNLPSTDPWADIQGAISLPINGSPKVENAKNQPSMAAKESILVKKPIAARARDRGTRKLMADALRKENTVLRRNKILGFKSGLLSGKKNATTGAPPLQGGLCK